MTRLPETGIGPSFAGTFEGEGQLIFVALVAGKDGTKVPDNWGAPMVQ